MRIGIFSMIAGSVLCFCISLAAVGQTAQQTRAGIVDVEPYASISVEFDVQAADKQLVIPVCGHVEDEKPSPLLMFNASTGGNGTLQSLGTLEPSWVFFPRNTGSR